MIEELIAARPEMPEGLRDRQMDAWEPLFAIADMAGGDWPARARKAALALSPALEDGGQAVGVRLLHDLRDEVLEDGEERVHLKDLAYRLNLIEDAGWGGWNDGKGITSREISRILKPFDLETKQFKIDDVNGKGYEVAAFGDAFERYLNPPGNPDPQFPRLLGYPAGQRPDSADSEDVSIPPKTASDQGGNRVTEGNGNLGYQETADAFEGKGQADFIRSWNADIKAQARARRESPHPNGAGPDLETQSDENNGRGPSVLELLALARLMEWPAVEAHLDDVQHRFGPGEFTWSDLADGATPELRLAAFRALEDLEVIWGTA